MGAPALLLKKRACAGTGPIKTGTDLVGVRFCSTLFIILRLAQIVNNKAPGPEGHRRTNWRQQFIL